MSGTRDAGRILASPYRLANGNRVGIQFGEDGMGIPLFQLVELWEGGARSSLQLQLGDRGTYGTIQEARAILDKTFGHQLNKGATP